MFLAISNISLHGVSWSIPVGQSWCPAGCIRALYAPYGSLQSVCRCVPHSGLLTGNRSRRAIILLHQLEEKCLLATVLAAMSCCPRR